MADEWTANPVMPVPPGIFSIRKATAADVPRQMEIYARARRFMAEHGNPNQWGPANWPPESLIRADIEQGDSYVCMCGVLMAGTFFYRFGKDVEPTYARIVDGAWLDDSPYGVVHRIAAGGEVPGTGAFCLDWAYRQCGHLRIDTHEDNVVMQNLLRKLGFIRTGTVFMQVDRDPRWAYEKMEHPAR